MKPKPDFIVPHQKDTALYIAHVIRKLREQYKRSDGDQLDAANWLTSTETSLLANVVCDIYDRLQAEGMMEEAQRFSREAHPRKEMYTDDTPF